ncbi:hypothetical protein BS47DRAFT_452539 [Hydnum rufescens UP504]|uniref:Uncharacterized protein n=1 Tax=Hydnum rufescens UP504 TaxID=1448309 RepID=A0A9P6AI17_9AGAM|nr:hypothetical protein BS47DRAFT_452539 [Hydnum rufescens UP504]
MLTDVRVFSVENLDRPVRRGKIRLGRKLNLRGAGECLWGFLEIFQAKARLIGPTLNGRIEGIIKGSTRSGWVPACSIRCFLDTFVYHKEDELGIEFPVYRAQNGGEIFNLPHPWRAFQKTGMESEGPEEVDRAKKVGRPERVTGYSSDGLLCRSVTTGCPEEDERF